MAGGVPVALLTTTGRRSALPHTTPLLFHREPPGSILLVAANGGADWNPDWLHNLLADPRAEVEIDGERVPVMATILSGPERAAVWDEARRAFPGLDAAQKRCRRTVPLLRLTMC